MHRTVHGLEKVAVDLACRYSIAEFSATAPLICELFHGIALNQWWKLGLGIVWEVARCPEEVESSYVRGENL